MATEVAHESRFSVFRSIGWRQLATGALALVMLGVLTAFASVREVDGEGDGEGIPDATVAEQRGLEAEAFAQHLGISKDEAFERVDLRRKFDQVLESLASTHAESFAGARVDHIGEFSMTVYIVGEVSKDVDSLLAEARADGLPLRVVSGRSHSKIELDSQALRAHDFAVEELGRRQVVSWVDVTSGDVQLLVGADASEAPARSGDFSALDMDNLSVQVSEEIVASDEHTYGGALTTTSQTGTSGCTTAFSVRHWSGTDGILTAGHCNNSRWYNMGSDTYQMAYQLQHKGSWGDFQWHTTSHWELDDFYADWGTLYDVTGIRTTSNMAWGDIVLAFGRVSGSKSTYIEATNVTRTVGSNTYGRQVRVMQDVLTNGDSGGPWFVGGTAYGVHGGDCGGKDCFSAVEYADEAVGVSVKTG